MVLAWRLCRLLTHGNRQRGKGKLNEYQEALNSIGETFHDATVTKDGGDLSKYFEIKETLQELVDRATPMKPIIRTTYDDDCGMNLFISSCPKCGCEVQFGGCCQSNECRQKIDWSNE